MMAAPMIRFKGFGGNWEKRKLGEVLKVNSGKDYKHLNAGNIPVYGTGGYMLSVDESLSEVDAIGIGRKGTIDKPQFLSAPFWTVDTLFFMTPLQDNVLLFLYALSQNVEWAKMDESTGVPSLSKVNIENVDARVPQSAEQTAIGNFFRTLDDSIALHKRKLDGLKELKKAYLQQMFPRTGERVPRVRFAGFSGDWVERKLEDVLIGRKIRQKITDEFPLLAFAAGQGVIDRSERKTNNRDFLTRDSSTKTYLLTHKDDIVYNPSNLKYGAIDRNKYGSGVISPIYVTFETTEIPSFIELIVTSESFKDTALQYEEGTVTKRQSVKPEFLLTLSIKMTTNKDEQTAIGNFFLNLDAQITVQQTKQDKLKQLKAAYLQRMFV